MLTCGKILTRRSLPFVWLMAALSAFSTGCYKDAPEPAATNKKVTTDGVKTSAATPPLGTAENPIGSRDLEPEPPKVVIRDKRDWTLPETAARSLGKIGSSAVPELTKDLNSTDPEVRQRAADVLARIGPAAKQAVPDLVAALEDDDEAVRKSAALALGQIGPAAADAVPALMRVMKEPGRVPEEGPPR